MPTVTVANQGVSLADASVVIGQERHDLYQLGVERARQSLALKPDAAQLATLEEHARAVVRSHNTEPYDPVKNLDDNAREEQFAKDKLDADTHEQAVEHSQQKVRECREQVAKSQVGDGPKITVGLWIVITAAVLALAGTLIPTVRDTLAAQMTEDFVWTTSVTFGVVFGLLVAASITLTFRLGGRSATLGLMGLYGGLAIAVGFLIFRVHMAADRSDALIAFGLAVVEVGAIFTLEWIGTHMRRVYAEWVIARDNKRQAQAILAAAESEEQKRKERWAGTLSKTSGHIQYVEERFIRRLKAPELEDAAVRAVRDGYLAGIAFNQKEVQSA